MRLPLVYYPNPSLTEPTKTVADFALVRKIVPDMVETMIAEKGVGLAAPQIGHNLRFAVIHKDADDSLPDHLVIINPKIFSSSRDLDEDEEGCLSIPGVEGIVPRHRKIKVRFFDLEGKEHKIKATKLLARVFQHEVDHLDGILFIERVTRYTKGKKPQP